MTDTLHDNSINDKNLSDLHGENKTGSPWFKCFPTDWLDGTRHLTPEQRGAYMDILCLIYKSGGAVRDDDKWIGFQLMISPRRWRAIRNVLLADGKLVETEAGLSNKRAEIEIENRVKLSRKLRETSANRERKKREILENANENNEADTSKLPADDQYTRASSDIRYQKEEKHSQLADTGSVAAGGPEEISGLNGSTGLIVETMAHWLNPWAPDYPQAHKSIADACRIYGPAIVRDAFGELKADHLDGKVRALSHKAFYGYCRTLKDRRDKAPAPGKPSQAEAIRRLEAMA